MVLVYILTNGGSCVAVISVLLKVTQTLGKLELGVKKKKIIISLLPIL